MTVPANQRSRRVMERLGMTRAPEDDFDHPRIPEGPLRRHVLYRLSDPKPRGDERMAKAAAPLRSCSASIECEPRIAGGPVAHCLITLVNVLTFDWVGTHVPVCMHLSNCA